MTEYVFIGIFLKDMRRKNMKHNAWGLGLYLINSRLMFRLFDAHDYEDICTYSASNIFDCLKLGIDGSNEVYTRE